MRLSLLPLVLCTAVSFSVCAEATDSNVGPAPFGGSKIQQYMTKHGVSVSAAYQTQNDKKLGFKTLLTNQGLIRVNEKNNLIVTGNDVLYLQDNGVLDGSNSTIIAQFLKDVPYKIKVKAPQEKAVIQVFTDITCPHCQEFEKKVGDFLSRGVSVEFLLFARNGIDRPEFLEMSAIQHSKNQVKALNDEMNGSHLTLPKKASAQMAFHQQAAISIGVHSTPTIYYKGYQIPNSPKGAPLIIKIMHEIDQDMPHKTQIAKRVDF